MDSPLRIIVGGATGRVGRRVADLALSDPRFALVAGVVRGPSSARMDLFPLISENELPHHLTHADAFIDFSAPAASLRFARAAAMSRKPIVIGTTGFSSSQTARLRLLAKKTGVLLSPNFSLGMNLLFHLAERAAGTLPGYDASISEVHHTQKKDAPSGTALRLADAVLRGAVDAAPAGSSQQSRNRAPIPIVSQRLGTVVGDHVLSLAGPGERLELIHRAESRDTFARGALQAALWVKGRRPGLYDMQNMLGLS